MGIQYKIIENGEVIGIKKTAGLFCYDCDVSLCKDVHNIQNPHTEWYDKCPSCGNRFVKTNISQEEIVQDLGLGKGKPKKKKGIGTCYSFGWYIDKNELDNLSKTKKIIVSEPGNVILTIGQFKKMLKSACSIHYKVDQNETA